MPAEVKKPDEFLRIARERWTRAESAEKNIRAAAQRDLKFWPAISGPRASPKPAARRSAPRSRLTSSRRSFRR